jgi:hypothetical protein
VPTLFLPNLDFLNKEYEPFDAGAMGELDVNILLKVYANEQIAKSLSKEWRGGVYYAGGRKGVVPKDRNSSAHVGLYYISRWSDEDSARYFAKLYAAALPRRYSNLQRAPANPGKPGLDRYSTSDGDVYIQQTENVVVAVETFDPANAEKLIQTGLKQAQEGLAQNQQSTPRFTHDAAGSQAPSAARD